VGDTWFSRSPGEVWVPASPLFFAEMDLASIVSAVRPVHRGVRHHSSWSAPVFGASGGGIVGDPHCVALWGVRALFLFDDRGRWGGRSVDRDVYPLRVFLGSPGGIVGLCVLHC